MNFKQANGKSIQQSFKEFNDDNPKVYELFKGYAFEAINKEKKKISSKMIINRIRWEVYMDTTEDTGYRINDAYTAHYARLFIKDYPQYEEMFEFRRIRSIDETIKHDEEGQINMF